MTERIVRELAIDQLELCKEYNTRVNTKTTVYEYTSRIGLIYGININYTLIVYYEYEVYQQCGIVLQHFEIRKEIVYE